MNRPDVMARLLQHGPLTSGEAISITGWPQQRVHRTIEFMRKRGELRRSNLEGVSKWTLTSTARVRAFAAEA